MRNGGAIRLGTDNRRDDGHDDDGDASSSFFVPFSSSVTSLFETDMKLRSFRTERKTAYFVCLFFCFLFGTTLDERREESSGSDLFVGGRFRQS